MGKREKIFIDRRLTLKPNDRLFRINAGMGWTGQSVKRGDDVLIKNARAFHGAPDGWPDLSGYRMTVITPDMVGKVLPVALMVEVKTPGLTLNKNQRELKENRFDPDGVIYEVWPD